MRKNIIIILLILWIFNCVISFYTSILNEIELSILAEREISTINPLFNLSKLIFSFYMGFIFAKYYKK